MIVKTPVAQEAAVWHPGYVSKVCFSFFARPKRVVSMCSSDKEAAIRQRMSVSGR